MSVPTLWQLRLSHYNEKARWALDHKAVAHTRRDALPGFHPLTALRVNRQQTLPILEIDGERIGDSAEIVEALERRSPDRSLLPEDPADRRRARELGRYFDDELGPATRRVFLFHMLGECPDALRDVWSQPAGPVAKAIYNGAFGALKLAVRQRLEVKPEAARRAEATVIAAFDRVEAELGDREYLVGARFSLADLTAAALFMPVVGPAELQYAAPPTSPGLQDFRERVRGRPGFAWVEAMWRRHRGTSAEIS